MSTPFFDDAARDLFDEIFTESLKEFREEKATRTEEPPVRPSPEPVVPPKPVTPTRVLKPLKSPPKPSRATVPRTPDERLHRAMFVLDMHKGRPHASDPRFRRKWLEEIMRAVAVMLAELPDEDTA